MAGGPVYRPATSAIFSLSALVGDLETIADRLGFETFDLLGIIASGPVAIRSAAEHPDCVRLVSSVPRACFLRASGLFPPCVAASCSVGYYNLHSGGPAERQRRLPAARASYFAYPLLRKADSTTTALLITE